MALKPQMSRSLLPEFRQKTLQKSSDFLVGYESYIDEILTALIAGGHALLIGLPGLGKTLLVKTLSAIWGLEFSRIQFTPDLLPSDITGTEILQDTRSGRQMGFQKGPVFANLLLADEINRTPPKTQSALLQAMEERQVTAGRKTYSLPDPFMVMATQNPIELEGTYPLPEAQLDRFLLSIQLQFPERNQEIQIAGLEMDHAAELDKIKPLPEAQWIPQMRKMVQNIPFPETLLSGLVDSVRQTRPGAGGIADKYAEYGAGPRATQYLARAARARALLLGDKVVTEKSLRAVFFSVLRHRILLNYAAVAEKIKIDEFLNDCIQF